MHKEYYSILKNGQRSIPNQENCIILVSSYALALSFFKWFCFPNQNITFNFRLKVITITIKLFIDVGICCSCFGIDRDKIFFYLAWGYHFLFDINILLAYSHLCKCLKTKLENVNIFSGWRCFRNWSATYWQSVNNVNSAHCQ